MPLSVPNGNFFGFGHNMGNSFGHLYESFQPFMSIPIGKEHHPMQIFIRIGSTVSMKSGDLNFGLK